MGRIDEEALLYTRGPNALRYEMNINLGKHVKITGACYFLPHQQKCTSLLKPLLLKWCRIETCGNTNFLKTNLGNNCVLSQKLYVVMPYDSGILDQECTYIAIFYICLPRPRIHIEHIKHKQNVYKTILILSMYFKLLYFPFSSKSGFFFKLQVLTQ